MVSLRTMGVVAAACLGGVALADIGGPAVCFEQMWSGIKQTETLGGKKCSSYDDCPKSIKCYAGRVFLTVAGSQIRSVACRRYTDGTWDDAKGRCVGGTQEETGPMSPEIIVEVCENGCN